MIHEDLKRRWRTFASLSLSSFVLAASAGLAPSVAAAQPAGPEASPPGAAPQSRPAPSEADKQAARELADKGYEHYESGDYTKAIQFFRDAEARFHAPTLLVVQAHAYVKLEGFVEARALYQRVVDEPLASDAPKEYVDAQAEAKAALASIEPRIATLKIVLKGMTPDRVTVTIDGVAVPPDRLLEPIPQNPGTHKVVATLGDAEEGRAVFQQITLKEGMTKQIQLVFRPGEPKPVPPPSGGCASCEVAAPRGAPGPAGLLSGLAAFVLASLRRRGRRSR